MILVFMAWPTIVADRNPRNWPSYVKRAGLKYVGQISVWDNTIENLRQYIQLYKWCVLTFCCHVPKDAWPDTYQRVLTVYHITFSRQFSGFDILICIL